jgi:hypothetical protein
MSRIFEEFPAPEYRRTQEQALADSSLLDLFERARADMPDWFAAQVDRMERPDLPAFAPGEALSGQSRAGTRRSQTRSDASEDHPLSDVWD